MKKLITPVIHAFFLPPMTGLTVGIELIARNIGLLGEFEGVIDTPTAILFFFAIIICGIPVFWLANVLMQYVEKGQKPGKNDFIRQSVLYFLIMFYCLSVWASDGFQLYEEDGYLLLWSGISMLAIVINYFFVRKRNTTRNTQAVH